MEAPKIYRLEISDIESIFRMVATPLGIETECVYFICDSQRPNSKQKKIAVKFIDKDGDGFDVYDYDKVVEYENIQGQYPNIIGPALIKDIETIYPDVSEMVLFTKKFHSDEQEKCNPNGLH